MPLEVIEPGQFKLSGVINFDISPVVEQQGRKLLLETSENHWKINLSGLTQADSSALSICLSWIRLAREHHKSICFSGLPHELEALAQVCGIRKLLDDVSCLANTSAAELK